MYGLMLFSVLAMGGITYLVNLWLKQPLTVFKVVVPTSCFLALLVLDWHRHGEASCVGEHGWLVMVSYIIAFVASASVGTRLAFRSTQVDP